MRLVDEVRGAGGAAAQEVATRVGVDSAADAQATVGLCRSIATRAHAGQVDKAGEPYIGHPAHVAASVEGEFEECVAWLHDVVEDTGITLDDLRALGVPDEVVSAVDALTRRVGEGYFDYVRRAGANALARPVKLADLRHNSDLSRLASVGPDDIARAEKYREAIGILQGL